MSDHGLEEPFFPSIWNVLHDGVIVGIVGSVPGNVRLDIEIGYLRKRFADPGMFIRVLLTSCTRMAYREYEKHDFSIDLAQIAGLRPEILHAEVKEGICEIACVDGTLEVIAADGTIQLDSGREITLQELLGVAEGYWKEWEAHWAKVRLRPKE